MQYTDCCEKRVLKEIYVHYVMLLFCFTDVHVICISFFYSFLQFWNQMLNLDCPESEIQIWHNLIAAVVQKRLEIMVIKIRSSITAWSKFNFLLYRMQVRGPKKFGGRMITDIVIIWYRDNSLTQCACAHALIYSLQLGGIQYTMIDEDKNC